MGLCPENQVVPNRKIILVPQNKQKKMNIAGVTRVGDVRQKNVFERMDWITVGLFLGLIFMGWINIYAAVYDPTKQDGFFDIFSMSLNSGKQLLWISLSSILIFLIMVLEFKVYDTFSYVIYGLGVALLIGVLLFGREVAGSKSWFDVGGIRFQPAEFTKVGASLAVARFISEGNRFVNNFKTLIPLLIIVAVPAVLIILQGDTGSALVFAAFFIVFYREGLPQYLTGLGLLVIVMFIVGLLAHDLTYIFLIVASISTLFYYLMDKDMTIRLKIWGASALAIIVVLGINAFLGILKPHQQLRIRAFLDPTLDPQGQGWQVNQSKIAIGSGGTFGRGFLEGTQTKFDFVPDQSTDFIFCTIGEEWGWMGTSLVIILFVCLLIRLVILAERQKSRFSQVYGYCVVAILFFHFMINIGMTIGLFPVIGIPLPFFSYGGSSLWSFTILLFIMVKLDAHRMQLLVR